MGNIPSHKKANDFIIFKNDTEKIINIIPYKDLGMYSVKKNELIQALYNIKSVFISVNGNVEKPKTITIYLYGFQIMYDFVKCIFYIVNCDKHVKIKEDKQIYTLFTRFYTERLNIKIELNKNRTNK